MDIRVINLKKNDLECLAIYLSSLTNIHTNMFMIMYSEYYFNLIKIKFTFKIASFKLNMYY